MVNKKILKLRKSMKEYDRKRGPKSLEIMR
jgi:hypothetical protein